MKRSVIEFVSTGYFDSSAPRAGTDCFDSTVPNDPMWARGRNRWPVVGNSTVVSVEV